MRSSELVFALGCSMLAFGCAVAADETEEIIDNLVHAGFPRSDIMVVDGKVYVGRDAEVSLTASREMIRTVDAGEEQYRTTNLISTSLGKICIDGSTFTGVFSTALDLAIQNYDEQQLTFAMARTPSTGCSFTINAVLAPGVVGGSSGFPSGGLPFGTINIGDGLAPFAVDTIEHVITHEIGHTIGFRHSDYFNRAISCGGAAVNEGDAGVGAILIPGTPSGAVVGGSIMNSCFRQVETGEFSATDITALTALYGASSDALRIERWATRQGGFWDAQQWVIGDFNGDGRLDMANVFNDGGLASIDVHLSTGASFGIARWATRQGGFWDQQKWIAGDFNGDGRADLANVFNDGGLASIDIHLSTGASVGIARWATRQGGFWDAQKWSAGDFNGDGRADLANVFNDGGLASIDVHLSTGGSVGIARWATRQGGFWDQQKWMAGDFNGDGRVDLANVFNDGGLASIDIHPSTGVSFGIQRWATRQGGFWDAQKWSAGDFNGDGRADLANVFNDGGLASIDVHLSTGAAFGIARWATRQGGFWDQQKWIAGDFNGDGRADLANVFNDGGLASIDVHLSTGASFGIARWATRQGGFWEAQKWSAGDFNGDGRADLANVFNDGGLASIDVHLSTGASVGIARWATRQGGFWDAQKWSAGDFNGDGRADLANVFNDGGLASIDVHLSTGASVGIARWSTRQGGFWDAQNWSAGDFHGE